MGICVGESGGRRTQAAKVLEQLRRNEKIADCSLHSLSVSQGGLKGRECELWKNNFSHTGNLGFGIQAHIDLGIKYDPSIGIYGLDYYVVLGRPGFSITDKKLRTGCIGTGLYFLTQSSVEIHRLAPPTFRCNL
ncbi:hypothetical protein U0070_018142 [Myodes glareolus]|uniref:Large ribosomal subunit protein uL5 C-terminal domain-containing protein n=1 Tax=Myodes glareolus TaxID=447135 RepID=A0AAW0HYP0_MYOGA